MEQSEREILKRMLKLSKEIYAYSKHLPKYVIVENEEYLEELRKYNDMLGK